MVKQEVIVECFALCVASLVAMTSALGDLTFRYPISGRNNIIYNSDIDTPDHAIISASPFGGNVIHSDDLGDSQFFLGGSRIAPAFQPPMLRSVLPSYRLVDSSRGPFPVHRPYGRRSRRMRIVPF